jgi:hypothetical protein
MGLLAPHKASKLSMTSCDCRPPLPFEPLQLVIKTMGWLVLGLHCQLHTSWAKLIVTQRWVTLEWYQFPSSQTPESERPWWTWEPLWFKVRSPIVGAFNPQSTLAIESGWEYAFHDHKPFPIMQIIVISNFSVSMQKLWNVKLKVPLESLS